MVIRPRRTRFCARFLIISVLALTIGGVLQATMVYGDLWFYWYDEPGACDSGFFNMCVDFCGTGVRHYHCTPEGGMTSGYCFCVGSAR